MLPSNIQGHTRSAITRVEACVADVRDWMLNDDKTMVILFGSAHQLRKVELVNVQIGDTSVNVSHRVQNLGVQLDDNGGAHNLSLPSSSLPSP